MTSLAETITRLRALRKTSGTGSQAEDRLDSLAFSPNLGALHARTFIPSGLAADAALVVVLHGCTQSAAGYDHGSGWSQLAERHGFALLFPEQQRANNPNLCFNWFQPGDTRRGVGEAESIRQMIRTVVAAHDIDPARIFATGLSAGGAMAGVMLACYPELFAGAAIIAGLPYGAATSMPEAFEQMRAAGAVDDANRAALVRNASSHSGPWPTLAVWQGSADTVVHPSNADALIGQWRALHGLGAAPTRNETLAGRHRHATWSDQTGRTVLERYDIAGMNHGTPLATLGEDGVGVPGAYMLEAGISSTVEIARSWGLVEAAKTAATHSRPPQSGALVTEPAKVATRTTPPAGGRFDVGKVIEDALRAAGVMR